jgi:hypothetical protein
MFGSHRLNARTAETLNPYLISDLAKFFPSEASESEARRALKFTKQAADNAVAHLTLGPPQQKNEDVRHFMLLRFARPWNKPFTHRLAFPCLQDFLPIKRLPPAGMCSFDRHRRIKLQLANQTRICWISLKNNDV